MTTKYAVQTLAACTAASRQAREELLKSDKSKRRPARERNLTHFPGLGILKRLTLNANRVFTGFTQQDGRTTEVDLM